MIEPAGAHSRGGVWVVGATSAVARAVARELAQAGYDLVLSGRDLDELEASASDLAVRYGVTASATELDILDFESHAASFEECLERLQGRLAGAVVCSGYLGEQALAEASLTETRRILDTNFTGAVSLLNLIATDLERRGDGFICVLSSVAGDRGRQSNYIYGAAKGGLTVYLQGLRNRLYRSGVRVVTVKPGFVDTGMTYGRPGMFLVASPEAVAKGIVRAIEGGKDVVYLPRFWSFIMFVIRSVPELVFKRLKL